MDLLPSIDELRDELMAHDLAVQEIIALDQYIERQTEQTFISNMSECEAPPFQRLIRIATAEGVKRMFKEYRLQKWLKVQDMADTVRQVLNAEAPREDDITDNTGLGLQESQSAWQRQQESLVPVPFVPTGNERQDWRPELPASVISPVPVPLIRLLSPIVTPREPASVETEHNPTVHSSPHVINRRLFPDGQCPNNGTTGDTHPDWVPYQVDTTGNLQPFVGIRPTSGTIHHVQEQPLVNSSMSQVNGNYGVPARTYQDQQNNQTSTPFIESFPSSVNQEHLVNIDHTEHLNDMDGEMDWDSDYDSSYDDSEENLAGVLFATQSLLPDEQAVRLDVEMGDMGVGHVMFDRVSAAWMKYHCAFNRHG